MSPSRRHCRHVCVTSPPSRACCRVPPTSWCSRSRRDSATGRPRSSRSRPRATTSASLPAGIKGTRLDLKVHCRSNNEHSGGVRWGGGEGGGQGGQRLRIGFKVKTPIGCLMCDTCSMNVVTSVTCAGQLILITRS